MEKSRLAILASLVTLVLASPVLAATDQEFITNAIKGDNSEITLGKLAMSKGNTAAVRAFGKTLMTDHSRARTEAAAAAKKLGVTPPAGDMTDAATTEYSKLAAMSGTAFDDEFVNYMVQDHQKDIGDFQDEAKSGGKITAALAKRQLPILQKHLKIATGLVGKG